jgi:hypothetical protein
VPKYLSIGLSTRHDPLVSEKVGRSEVEAGRNGLTCSCYVHPTTISLSGDCLMALDGAASARNRVFTADSA